MNERKFENSKLDSMISNKNKKNISQQNKFSDKDTQSPFKIRASNSNLDASQNKNDKPDSKTKKVVKRIKIKTKNKNHDSFSNLYKIDSEYNENIMSIPNRKTNRLNKLKTSEKKIFNSNGGFEKHFQKTNGKNEQKGNLYELLMDYIELENPNQKNFDTIKYTFGKSELENIKKIKENIKNCIKEKKSDKNKRKKNKLEGIHKQYLNLLSFDKKDDSCFDDDLFFLKEDNNYVKSNKKINKLEERRKYRLEKRKSKKVIHKKQQLVKSKKNPFILSIDEYLETEKDENILDKYLKKKIIDCIESKGQPDFFKEDTSKNDDDNEFLFHNEVNKFNKKLISDKENSEINQNFNDPDKKYKRTFEMNLASNKLAKDNLKFKLKLNYRLKSIYWSNNLRFENLDSNFPDVYNNLYTKIREDFKKNYIENVKEGISRKENMEESILMSLDQEDKIKNQNEFSDVKIEKFKSIDKYEEEQRNKFEEIGEKLQKLKSKINERNVNNNMINEKPDQHLFLMKNYELMQRLYKYNHDLKNILKYWRENIISIKRKKDEIKNSNTKKPEDAENKELNIVTKINKKEIGVKYDFKKPEENVRKLIPLCNDIFTIAKNEQ